MERTRHMDPTAALRIGVLIDSLVTGGAERLVVTFAGEAVRRPGVELTVFTLSDADTPFRREIEALGVPIVVLPGRSLVDPLRFARLVRELGRRRLDVLHGHLSASIVLGGAASAILGVPFAATVHNVRPSTPRFGGARRTLYRAMLSRPGTCRIAVGRAVAESNAADAAGRPFVVVPNAVPPGAVWRGGDREATRTELGLAPGEVALVAVGLVIGQKGYPDLVEAFAQVAAERPEARLLIVGASPWRELTERLDARIAELGLGDRVRFLGLRPDVPRILAASDLFVSASHWEGAPVSLLEAMANGLPCVVTDVGDNAATLEGTGARVVAAGHPPALAGAISDFVADPAARAACARAVRRRALQRYGVAAWVDRLLALYAGGPTHGTLVVGESAA